MTSDDDQLLDHKDVNTVQSLSSTAVITRIAGIFGLIAVALGAYGFHGKQCWEQTTIFFLILLKALTILIYSQIYEMTATNFWNFRCVHSK